MSPRGRSILLIAAVLLLPGTASADALTFSDQELRAIRHHSPLPPPPPDPSNAVADSPAAARLGQYLFYDKRLSGRGDVACVMCHDPARNWTDGKRAVDVGGLFPRNVPSLWNTAFNRWFFWDGRADSAWAQTLGPLENPTEHGGTRLQYAHLIYENATLRHAYEAVFGAMPDLSDRSRFPPTGRPLPAQPTHPQQVAWASMSEPDRAAVNRTFANVGKAIAAYVRRLLSRASPFDTFVEGLTTGDVKKLHAISGSAQRGLRLFVGEGRCALCHSGPNFTDGEFHDIGLAVGGNDRIDPARYAGTRIVIGDPFNALGPDSDDPSRGARAMVRFIATRHGIGQFKTPSLRNVAKTAPYMHDGRFATLDEVVEFYSTRKNARPLGQLQENVLRPLDLGRQQRADLVEFLKSLSGQPLDPALTRPVATPAEP